jgi:hypothetical protein
VQPVHRGYDVARNIDGPESEVVLCSARLVPHPACAVFQGSRLSFSLSHATTVFGQNRQCNRKKIMKIQHRIILWLALPVLLTINLQPSTLLAQGTAFTYQGRLNGGGQPANGSYDLQFTLYATNVNGSPAAGPVTNLATTVSNGLFTATVDFGAGVFNGAEYWLDVAVRTNGTGAFTELTPRQTLTPAPYALYAASASAAGLNGTIPAAQLPATVVTNNQAGVTLGNLTVSGNLTLPGTTAASGIIYSGGSTLLDAYGSGNFFAGPNAGNLTMSGTDNTGIGVSALSANTSGSVNAANGYQALYSNTTGTGNTANGYKALLDNTSGNWNTANGFYALYFNTNGYWNTANGGWALMRNTSGYWNTANGISALYNNTSGWGNTANGAFALIYNTNGDYNTADGISALYNNTSGSNNTANGGWALSDNTSGNNNTAIGYEALCNNSSGSNNIALGFMAGYNLTTGSSNIDIGNLGTSTDNNIIRIGTQGIQTATYLAGIYGATTSGGSAVYVDANGQLGTATSSRRFKQNIQPMGEASDVLLALRPVTFHYKPEIDRQGLPQFGLVAEEVAQVDPDLIVRDKDGQPYSVRYEQVNAMLLNEFLKEHRKVEALEQSVAELRAAVEKLSHKPEVP